MVINDIVGRGCKKDIVYIMIYPVWGWQKYYPIVIVF